MTDDTEIHVHRWPIWKVAPFVAFVCFVMWAGFVKIAEMIWSIAT